MKKSEVFLIALAGLGFFKALSCKSISNKAWVEIQDSNTNGWPQDSKLNVAGFSDVRKYENVYVKSDSKILRGYVTKKEEDKKSLIVVVKGPYDENTHKSVLLRVSQEPSEEIQWIQSLNGEYNNDLLEQATKGDAHKVGILISIGADIKTTGKTDKFDETALMIAACKGHADVVKALTTPAILETRAGKKMLKMQNFKGDTALMVAARDGHANVVEALTTPAILETHLETHDGQSMLTLQNDITHETALMIAAYKGHANVVKALTTPAILETQEGKKMLKMTDKHDETALMLAAWAGRSEVVELLLKKTTEDQNMLNIQNKNGETALMLAARDGHADVVKALTTPAILETQVGKDMLNIQNKNGETALTIATENQYTEIIAVLTAALQFK